MSRKSKQKSEHQTHSADYAYCRNNISYIHAYTPLSD